MSTIPVESQPSLYALTPAVYRIADAELGEPLRALMSVLEEPYRLIEGNVGELYDDWFIETCAAWLVPYIGELVGVRAAFDPSGVIPTVRSRVGNAIAYSRRKGPAWVLARAARDSTGWQARTVEFFRYLAQTQDLRDVRPGLGGTADLRFPTAVEAGTPFDRMAHTPEVRGPDANGRWAAERLGLYLWRLASYPLTGAEPRPVPRRSGCYTFDPFGVDTQLFLPPCAVEPFGREPPPWDVPGPISRELLVLALRDDPRPDDPWKASEYPVVAIRAGSDAECATEVHVVPADLSAWRILHCQPTGAKADQLIAAVDPVLGRLAFVGAQPAWVRADFSYGFSADLGGGPYARSRADPAPGKNAFVVQVGRAKQTLDGVPEAGSVDDALRQWGATTSAEGVVLLLDSATHATPSGRIDLAPGRRLWIIAAAGQRPCLSGDLQFSGVERSGVILVGVAVDGGVKLSGEVDLTVSHCTIGPPVGDLLHGEARRAVVAEVGFTGTVTVSRSVLGPLSIPAGCGGTTLTDSIVASGVYAAASGTSDAEAGVSATLTVTRCTVFGLVWTQALQAVDSIFVDGLLVEHPESGGLVCCYALPGTRSPARDRCQPAPGSSVRPLFTSRRYGDAGFAQLAATCPASIRTGATDGAEMGAFHLLDTPRREQNLRATVDEFLPNGLEVVVSYVT